MPAVWEGEMHRDLPALLALQELDQKIARIRSEVAQLPVAKQKLEATIEQAKRKLQEAKQTQQAAELIRRQKEGEIEELRRRMNRYQAQQMQARKNEEYQALSHEILQVKAKVEREEDEVLRLLEKADELKLRIREEERNLEEVEIDAQQKRRDLAEKEARLTGLLTELAKNREEKMRGVDPALFAQYQQLVQHHRENAVVPIVHGSCGGCHMRLTRQTILRTEAAREPAFCENCGRILFIAG